MVKLFLKKTWLLCIITLLIVPANYLQAQAIITNDSTLYNPAHQFLWFTGHWNPTNKKQFIIDKDSTTPGGTILIGSDGAVHLNSPGINNWNKKMDESIKIIDDWENNINHPASADLATYDLNQLLLPEVKGDKATYTNYKIDPNTNILDPVDEKKAMNNLAANVAAECQKFKSSYDNIMAFWKAHKKDKDADLSIPPPPEFEYNCYACDSNLRKVYDTTIAHYVRDFFHPEDSLIRMGLGIIRSFALMGIGPASANGGVYQPGADPFSQIRDLFNTNKKDPSKSGACAYLDLYTLNNAILDIAYHSYRRSQELLRRYRKDFRAVAAIAKVSLTGMRDMELFGGICNEDYAFGQLAYLVGENIRFYTDKLKQHDWKQLANFPFILGLMRQKALLGGNDEDFSFMSSVLNNFYLSIDMDIKVGKDDGYMLCHLKGETKITIDFVQDENQCYRWVAAEDSPKVTKYYEGIDWKGNAKYTIIKDPVKKMLQKIDMDLLANQITGPSPLLPVYAGTKKYAVLLKNLKIDFCNPGDDSLIVSTFVPSPDAKAGIWHIPNSKPVVLGINNLDHFFQDEEKMQEIAESGGAQASADEMKKQAEEIKTKMQSLANQMGNGKNKADLEKYIALQKMATQSQDLSNSTRISPMLAMVFQLPVENSPILVHKKFDAKELNPKQANVIVYGYYTVHIEYRTR